jgi:hypothetical protein
MKSQGARSQAKQNPTAEHDDPEARITTYTCPGCGMPQRSWPDEQGFRRDGQPYCCRGCAEGTGCTCKADPGAP